MEFLTFCVFRKQQPNQKKVGAEVGGGQVQDHLRHIVQGLCGDKIRYVAYAMYSTMVAPDIVFFSFGNSQRDEVNLNLLSSAQGLDDGLVKHV